MSDEIKKEQSAELAEPAQVEASGALSEKDLDQVGGGKASPTLAQACANGEHLKKGTLVY